MITEETQLAVTLLIAFLSLFFLSPKGLLSSMSLSCTSSQSAVDVAMVGPGAPSVVLLASGVPFPPYSHQLGCLQTFTCPGDLGSGKKSDRVIGNTVASCGAK